MQQPNVSKLPMYMATTAPGLEKITLSEMQSKLTNIEISAQLRGRILFATSDSLEKLFRLKCIDNLYSYIGCFQAGPHKMDLARITQSVQQLEIEQVLLRFPGYHSAMRAIVSASRSGHHTYSRFDAAAAALVGLVESYNFQLGTTENHELAFRLDIMDTDAYLSIKLTPPSFRFRGNTREFSPAALRPSIAHALVWLSQPHPEDTFLDPFCGSGTIVAERACYPAVSIMALDISHEAVSIARQNTPYPVEIKWGDACKMNVPSTSIQKIVTNLPWGKQIQIENVGELYMNFLAEARRILHPGGKLIALTDREEELTRACKKNSLHCSREYTISLHGSIAGIFIVSWLPLNFS